MQSIASGLALLLLILQPAQAYCAQDNAPAENPRGEFFSGTITALTDDKITVSRTVLGKSEARTFVITTDTRVEGKLRVKVRVTVRFATEDETDRALHIIVRTTQKK